MGTVVQLLDNYQQTPDETLQYTLDFSQWLGVGETISNTSWEVDNATTPPLVAADLTIIGETVAFFVSGGKHLQKYVMVIEIETNVGNTKQIGIGFRIKDFTP